ncbi:MAG TPA: inverse autotransporter beta domain-containing protein, partial [Rhabdochlamydiaceae bacterium]
MSKRTVSFFLLSILTYTSSYALLWDASKREVCEWTPHPERVTVRHIEAKGVGYGQGYTTLEAFLTAPSQLDSPWFPFLDLRGHVFNNGKLASNLGLGLRYTSLSRVWGINSYYDFRQNSHRNFNQYGFGLESLGRVWDFRINGYLPFGKKQSSYYDTHFGDFKGHYLYLSQKRVIAFKGANAEAGVHAKVSDNVTFYAAAGPYVIGHRARNAWGGEGRIAFDFTKYVRLEGNASYDRIFKGIVQGQLSINIPFGPRQSIAPEKPNSCSKQLMLCDRMLQR